MPSEDIDHSSMDPQHKRSAWFDRKIAIRNLDGKQKSEIAGQVIDDMTIQLEYRSQMFLSIVVATLGLLINATPVVIGAMIIAPILRPIQAVSFATATGNRSLFGRSLRTLFVSVVGGVFVAFALTLFLPLTEVTNEIAIRTQPTLVDLGIAFASGLVAFLAFGRKKMAAGLAGVAMAASLVPPLAVIGIGIGFGSTYIAWGSTVLFLTNLIAIIIAGILIFYLFGFYPTQKDDLKRSLINSLSALVMLILLCIPLASSLVTITRNVTTQSTIKKTTHDFVRAIDERISLETLAVERHAGAQEISLTLKVPQELVKQLTEKEQAVLTEQLSTALQDEVTLDMRLLPVTRVTQATTQQISTQEKIRTSTREFLSSLYHNKATLLDLNYYTTNKRIVVANIFSDNDFPTDVFTQQYETFIKESYPEVEKTVINWQHDTTDVYIPLTKNQAIQKELQESFSSYFSETVLHKLDVVSTKNNMNINIYASTPLSNEEFEVYMTSRKELLYEVYDKEITTTNYLSFFDTF